ncbi:MAG: hypothetical protein DME31_09390 [Verrucomicrobia bacterium]|nr:MAG: hypothetical protein DME31_09390 [Verrucomicrobiota bacterium]
MLAAHLENLLFLLLLALAGLFQLLGRAARKTRVDEEEPTPKSAPRTLTPIPRAPVQSDEERIRKFLEALGQPAASRPPPPVTPRTDIPPRPLAPVRPPVEPLIPHWKLTPEERRKRPYILKESPLPGGVTPAEQISAPAMTAVPAFQVHESPLRVEQQPIIKTQLEAYAASKTFGVAKTEDLKTDIATLLASKSGLRDAIILREIFGPPRGLQALEIGNIACSP